MNETKNLETLYLQAKIAYYEGAPTMTDAEFDALENKLKGLNSKVTEQVGSKRSDFDFPHPTKMLSLAKIQTENVDGVTNYQKDLFLKWFNSRISIITNKVGTTIIREIHYTPKFDGNAINIIYESNKLSRILTRGDGLTGKNITDRFRYKVPEDLKSFGYVYINTTIEIRCEVVIAIKTFNEKYSEFANARNFVAGVIGKDDYIKERVDDLDIIPLHFLVNGEHNVPNIQLFKTFFKPEYFGVTSPDDYEYVIKEMENIRKTFKYQLDGIVFDFPSGYKNILGVNDHDPEGSIAIKFVPEEAVTEVTGIEWNVGKTGEIVPTILVKPIQLAGTTVKRVSGYNAGYIIKNKIGKGSIVSMAKSGDIIPNIRKIITETDVLDIPKVCPDCHNAVISSENIHLICFNDRCPGKILKKLHTSAKAIDLKDVGEETLRRFSYDFYDLYEVIIFILTVASDPKKLVEQYGFKEGSRSLEKFIASFKNIRSLSVSQVIQLFGYENVGHRLSEQVAKLYYDDDPDFKGHEKSWVGFFKREEIKERVMECIDELERLNIKIDKPIKRKDDDMKTTIKICMTGSPKPNWDTKSDFISSFDNVEEVAVTDPKCDYLITNDLGSMTSKMKNAEKKGVKIVTYEEFKDIQS